MMLELMGITLVWFVCLLAGIGFLAMQFLASQSDSSEVD